MTRRPLAALLALAAATTNAFAVTGRGPGPLRQGAEASLIVVAGDPLADIAILRRLEHVVLRGRGIPARNGEGGRQPQAGGGGGPRR